MMIPVVSLLLACVMVLACATRRVERVSRGLPAECGASMLYVALGDSTVEGVAATSRRHNYVSRIHQRLREVYPAARVENLGVSGAVSADVVRKQLSKAVRLQPHLVTLSVGPNDITGGIPVEQYEKNVDRILRRLTQESGALVVVNLLPDLAVTPRFAHADEREIVGRLSVRFNEVLERKARQYSVELVDLYERSREEVPRRPELVASDGYHPSDLGYARWAELMWTRVEAHVPRC